MSWPKASLQKSVIESIKKRIKQADLTATPATEKQEVESPAKEIVTSEIAGIEIMELDDAVKALWAANIYAESGMGCTGPIVLVNEKNVQAAQDELKKANYL